MGDSNLKLILISSILDCTTFHSFNVKKKKNFKKLAGLWLAGEMVDHIGIYGSKVAEGLMAFQRRSCSPSQLWVMGYIIVNVVSSVYPYIGLSLSPSAPQWS